MPNTPPNNRLPQRLRAALAEALGSNILKSLRDESVVEVMVNPDNSIWIDHRNNGRVRIGEMQTTDTEAVIRFVAAHTKRCVNQREASISAMLPELFAEGNIGGLRFQGMLPPVVSTPSFAIRKLSSVVWSLDNYDAQGIATSEQVKAIREAIEKQQNILVAGGTGSGKTTLLNACLAESAFCDRRVIILEDTEELQFSGKDSVRLLAKPPITLCELIKKTLRMRPDRIIVGEVRGPEAHDMLKAWNTGHPGGICSLHADGACDALHRLQDLANEQTEVSPQKIIRTIDLVVFICRNDSHPARRVIQAVARPFLNDSGDFEVEEITPPMSG